MTLSTLCGPATRVIGENLGLDSQLSKEHGMLPRSGMYMGQREL